MGEKKNGVVNTPYDDVFRTLLNDCSELMIPVINEIFDKKLLFLIPFYIFSHESWFAEYDKDEDKLEMLKSEYTEIVNRLDACLQKGVISVYIKKTILEMSGKVLENIARRYDNVREGVKSVMGGRVLEYEAKTILNEGMKQGLQQGLQEGAIKKAKETARNLRGLGMDDNAIADAVNVQVALVKEWFAESGM